ncbi:hypothetical protein QZJ86_02100 [Methylomonas montana]|uniref:hypothetical protein n=1 Tax=Methylomonas montana TaxID=3058963 RepID=UPI00265AD728|nr:hypothetical protein [Methylomonas montana]WKJ90940.1 hypothetical protein QZJ86_02100 [Methylomonas montana]
MIELPIPTETRIIQAARAAGVSISTFLDRLLDEYIEDKADIEQAERALQEPGEISAEELKAKYGL